MIDYSSPGPLTTLRPDQLRVADGLPDDPVALCRAVQSLVIQPHDAVAAGVPDERLAERNLRPVHALLDALVALDPSPLTEPRAPEHRVVGTCRHFALIGTALLRLKGIAARARCGFGAYFVEGRHVDHWIVEHRLAGQDRWIRTDLEHLDREWPARVEDLRPEEFRTGGEAWSWYRTGAVDGEHFGVLGVDFAWGAGEIRANAIRDLAALNKLEMLPWDEWSQMEASFRNEAGAEFDALMDQIADPDDPEALYRTADLAVPPELIR